MASNPIGSSPNPAPQSYSFNQLQKLVNIMDPSPFKSVDQATIGEQPAASDDQDVIIMKKGGDLLQSDTPQLAKDIANDLGKKGVQVDDTLDLVGGVAAHVDAKEAAQLKEDGYMIFDNRRRSLVPPVPQRKGVAGPKADDDQMPKVDPSALTGAGQANAMGFTGKGQVVAVIDSGFDHPETNLVAWKDFVDGDTKPTDPVGHGTHVAGDVLQMAPDAKIVSIRVMNEQGQGRPSDIIRGIQYAVANKDKFGITTINMSLGGEPTGVPSHLDPLDRAVENAIKKGITVVAAAGNSGPGEHTIGPPADDPLAISVGSGLDRTHLSDFSSRGPTDDNESKPDVVAPGEFIVSWNVQGSMMDKMGKTVEALRHMTPDQVATLLKQKPQLIEALGLPDDITTKSPEEQREELHKHLPPIYEPDADHIAAPGTSFASPIVAGIVANVKQANPSLTPQQIKQVLTSTASSMGSQYGPNDQGSGFVNADKAVAAAQQKASARQPAHATA
jgi:subtilisin family serine protease